MRRSVVRNTGNGKESERIPCVDRVIGDRSACPIVEAVELSLHPGIESYQGPCVLEVLKPTCLIDARM